MPNLPPSSLPNPAPSSKSRVVSAAENAWMQIAATAQLVGDYERAQSALDMILRHNPYHAGAYVRIGHLLHNQQQYMQAAESYQKAISLLDNGHGGGSLPATWAALAHCWLLLDDLPRAFNAYQQALGYPGGARDSSLWFGVGLLYDRYGADEHALEAFSAALKLESYLPAKEGVDKKVPNPMIRETFYRVGNLLRNRKRFEAGLRCFEFVLHFPPAPLQRGDIKLQMAITHELKDEKEKAMSILRPLSNDGRRVIGTRARCLLGWFMVKGGEKMEDVDKGISTLKTVVADDQSDALAWYFLGRAHFLRKSYNLAYEAYQEAVYRDGQNAAFWNSIGILYSEIKQFRDALDAFSRAIHQNPAIAEVWWNLGILYETCNNQSTDAIDAYQRAAEISPADTVISGRLSLLRSSISGNSIPPLSFSTQVRELDPFPYVTRSILLGAAHIPPQKTVNIAPLPRPPPNNSNPPAIRRMPASGANNPTGPAIAPNPTQYQPLGLRPMMRPTLIMPPIQATIPHRSAGTYSIPSGPRPNLH